MFKITNKEVLTKDTIRITVEAPLIAQKAMAGQFVVVIVDEFGERVPLTLADWDRVKGTITLIFQEIGFSTKKLGTLNIDDSNDFYDTLVFIKGASKDKVFFKNEVM